MINQEPQSTDSEVGTPTEEYFVVYDKNTGKVIHIHETITFANSAVLDEEPALRALRLANRQGVEAEVLRVERDEISTRKTLVVDTATRRLRTSDS